MKLNKAKLIETARLGIIRARENQVTWDRQVDEAEKRHEQRWKDSQVEKWRPFRDKLTKALKDGSHITMADIPLVLDRYTNGYNNNPVWERFNRGTWKSEYGGKQTWSASHNYGPRPVDQIGKFEMLAEFLETVEDEIVTIGQLQSVGFRNLEKLFTAATSGFWAD
jgi:hypothetical protein